MEESGEREFLCHGIAANHRSRFEYQARESRPGKVSSCNQAVMSSASNYDVELLCHLRLLLIIQQARSNCPDMAIPLHPTATGHLFRPGNDSNLDVIVAIQFVNDGGD